MNDRLHLPLAASSLKQSEALNLDLQALDAMTQGQLHIRMDLQGQIESLNHLACAKLQVQPLDLIGKPLTRICKPGPTGDSLPGDWLLQIETTAIRHLVSLSTAPEIRLQTQAVLLMARDLSGEPIHVDLYAQDLSDLFARENADLANLKALRAQTALIEIDSNGKILYLSEKASSWFGSSSGQLCGKSIWRYLNPVDAGKSTRAAGLDFSHPEELQGEYFLNTESNIPKCLEIHFIKLGPAGSNLLMQLVDISERKQESAEFKAKVEAIDLSQAVIEFDLQGHVISANRNFQMAVGYQLDEIKGKHHSLFCTEAYRQSAEYREFWLNLNDGKFISGRFHRVGKFGRDVWIQATYNPIFDQSGKVVRVVKFAHDVTKEVALQHSIANKSAEMTAGIEKIVGGINDISRSTGQAKEIANQSSRAAQNGYETMNKSLNTMESIQQNSALMQGIVSTISELANQTNLLAFNAAIEAVRAGENGIGFSVVAAEVQKLAERSLRSAQEISLLINKTTGQIEHGYDLSRVVSENFEGLLRNITQTEKSVESIVRASERQRQDSQSLVKVIEKLNAETRQE